MHHGAIPLTTGVLHEKEPFSKFTFQAQHFYGFQPCLAYRIAESGVWVPEVAKRYAKTLPGPTLHTGVLCLAP